MIDTLYSGSKFRTFNVIDDFNRECLAVEIDMLIAGKRLIRVFERLKTERGLPETLRVDNGPEFLSGDFVAWAEQAGMSIRYIEPGQPNQNAYVERFNRTTVRSFLACTCSVTLTKCAKARTHGRSITMNTARMVRRGILRRMNIVKTTPETLL